MRRAEDHFARFAETGDPDALAHVWDATAPALYRLASRIAIDPSDAEEAVQRCFLAAIESARRYDARRSLMPWLVAILRAQLADIGREHRRHPTVTDDALRARPGLEDPSDDASAQEIGSRLEAAIDELPEALRSVVRLRVQHDLSPSAIARVLERPPSTIRTQLARARERLRLVLPATLLALLGRPLRGLSAVKQAVLHVARSSTPALCAGAALKPFCIVLGALAIAVLIGFQVHTATTHSTPFEEVTPAPVADDRKAVDHATEDPDTPVQVRRVRDESVAGTPVARLRVHGPNRRPLIGIRVLVKALGVAEAATTTLRTDREGIVEASLPPGRYRASCNDEHRERRNLGPARIEFEVRNRPLERTLELEHARSALHVRVVEDRGRPTPEVWLSLLREPDRAWTKDKNSQPCTAGNEMPMMSCNSCHKAPDNSKKPEKKEYPDLRYAQTDANGHATFEHLSAGTYRILLGRLDPSIVLFRNSAHSHVALAQRHGEYWLPPMASKLVTFDGLHGESVQLQVARSGKLALDFGPRDGTVVAELRSVPPTEGERRALASRCGMHPNTLAEITPGARRRTRAVLRKKKQHRSFEDLPPGPYELHFRVPASSARRAPAPARITIHPGRTTTRRVDFHTSHRVASGQLLVDAREAAGWFLVVRNLEGQLLKTVRTDESGRYEVRGMPATGFTLQCFSREVAADVIYTRVRAGENVVKVAAPGRGLVHRLETAGIEKREGALRSRGRQR